MQIKNLKNNRTIIFGSTLALAGIIFGGAQYASAQNINSTNSGNKIHFQKGISREKPTAVGTVSSINGTSITLLDSINNTTYTVDASAAKILKAPTISTADIGTRSTTRPEATTIALSDLKVGDSLVVRGQLNGTTINATEIVSGAMGKMGDHFKKGNPNIVGTVSAINGNALTVTGFQKKASVTYTVDVSGAKFLKAPTTLTKGTKPELTSITLSDIKVGDKVMVKGTISDTSVTATEVVDGQFPHLNKKQKTQS